MFFINYLIIFINIFYWYKEIGIVRIKFFFHMNA